MTNIPIGGIIAWAKSSVGTPNTLPHGWAECNGQSLSDPQSPFNGKTLPDLNDAHVAGVGRSFLIGSPTSGGTEEMDFAAAADPGDFELKAYTVVWIIRVK